MTYQIEKREKHKFELYEHVANSIKYLSKKLDIREDEVIQKAVFQLLLDVCPDETFVAQKYTEWTD